MNDLSEWLGSCIAEDEDAAHYSGPALVAWLTLRDDEGRLLYTTVAASDNGEDWVADGKEVSTVASPDVVYDPARALRDAAFKRVVLAEHKRGDNPPGHAAWFPCVKCYERSGWPVMWPCLTVRALIPVYEDRRGYERFANLVAES